MNIDKKLLNILVDFKLIFYMQKFDFIHKTKSIALLAIFATIKS